MTLKEKVLIELEKGAMSDRELTDRLLGVNAPQQSINQICRHLAEKGIIARTSPPIKNILKTQGYIPLETKKLNDSLMSEESIKNLLNIYLQENGGQTVVAWGGTHGIDIDAHRNSERWIIEVKGCGSRNAMRVNYFLGILGELLQRMDDPNARYSIALPDLQQYKNLWSRLPDLAKQRTGIDIIFVAEDGKINFAK